MRSELQISDFEKKKCICMLTAELAILRAKAGIPQEELSKLVGISRQTYGAIERGKKEMTWEIYMALLFFFDKNRKTRKLLHDLNVYPDILVEYINDGVKAKSTDLNDILGYDTSEIIGALDAQAVHSINTVLMAEYARCRNIAGNAVIKAFGGFRRRQSEEYDSICVNKNIQLIKSRQVI